MNAESQGARSGGSAVAARESDQAEATSRCGETRELAPGLVLQTVAATEDTDPAYARIGDGCIHLLRADPAHYELRILTASEHGQARPAPRWAEEFGLAAVTNTSMFRPGGRSTGLLYDRDHVDNDRETRKFGAFLAFDPAPGAADAAPLAMFGRGCDGFDLDEIRSRYRAMAQSYRLLDCAGEAIEWKDEKRYSAAAVAVDDRGHVVFVHVRTPYLMRQLARMLAAPELRLEAAMFTDGGHMASLYVAAGGVERELVGSFEDHHQEEDNNHVSWALPNVLALVPRSE